MQEPGEIPLAHHPGEPLKRLSRHTAGFVTAFGLAILTIALVLAVASLSWWDLHSGEPWNQTARYYLWGPCLEGGSCGDYTDSNTLRSFFPKTYALVLMAVVLSVLEPVFLVLALCGRRVGLGILLTGIVGSIILLISHIYFYFAWNYDAQGNFQAGFSGSFTKRGVTYTFGGGPGWFMAPFVAIFFLAATIVVFVLARHVRPLGTIQSSLS